MCRPKKRWIGFWSMAAFFLIFMCVMAYVSYFTDFFDPNPPGLVPFAMVVGIFNFIGFYSRLKEIEEEEGNETGDDA